MPQQPTKPIAVIQGADGVLVQQLMREFVTRHDLSARIAGVIEEAGYPPRKKSTVLRSITDGSCYSLFQDLGSGSAGCALDPEGVTHAGEALLRDIASGCDLMVISKFGKLEADGGSGLVPAFIAALEAKVPVLISVSPRYAEAWTRFADPFYVVIPAEAAAIESWWAARPQR